MSGEDERAKKFVERHFPEISRFLAAERAEGPVPVYGPTGVQNAHDDQPEPHVVVRVDYLMSRIELFAALAAGYATTNVDVDPDSMTVEEIRYDVEAQLADGSWRDLEALIEGVAGKVERGEDPEQMQALRRAMDRAYPVRPAERSPEFAEEFPHVAAHLARERGELPPVQRPRYGDGTVTLQTLDEGEISIIEPAWCRGHDGEQIVQRVDVTHVGAEVAGEYAGVPFLSARISWAPFAQLQPEPYPVADVEDFPALNGDELRDLAAEAIRHGGALYRLANDVDRLRRNGS